ncbi:MAG: septal ring lytic transglycosylase RlpA family protein [Methylocella sp.]
MIALAGCAVGMGGCAQQPQLQRVSAHSKEYFPSSKYGPASPRVVADGEPVPRGGGTYMVGQPYSVAGHTYYPSEKRYAAIGLASWYGDAFHGRRTANGEVYDRDGLTAAHPTMPLPSYARVTNLYNHRSIIVRVNDRGPFAADRIMDVSRRTAEALEFREGGAARVKVEYIGAASLAGSDDEKLLATLRLDGPATLDGETPTMVADAGPRPIAVAALDPRASGQPSGGRHQRAAASDDDEPAAPVANARRFVGSAPLPPPRPYDLGARAPAASSRLHVAARTKEAE